MHEMSDVATDPAAWNNAVSQGGRTVLTGMRDGVQIRVIVDSQTGEIIFRLSDKPAEESVTRQFDAAYYEDLRGRVRGVLIAVAETFPAQQVGLVDELIDANEAGVALEMLVGMLVEASVPVASDVVDQIERLVQDMELSSDVAERVRELQAT